MERLGNLLTKSQIGLEPGSDDFVFDQKAHEQAKVDSYNKGIGYLNLEDGYDCPVCKNRGMVAELVYREIYDSYQEVLVPCKCMNTRKAIKRLQRSGLEKVVQKYTFDKYQTPEPWHQTVKETAQKFCQDQTGAWFFIGGQSGSGKTHICTAIAVHHIRKGKEVRYMVWPDEIGHIQSIVNDAEKYGPLMRELKETPVLYIDDLFKHGKDGDGKTRWPLDPEIRRAFEIINYRYNKPDLITIISCEWTLFDLNMMDEALAGRIAERSKAQGYCINLKHDAGKNWRMKGLMEL